MISRRFIERLKLSSIPQYKIAIQANVHPSLLSKWITGAQPARDGDARLIYIGKLLGLQPDDVFENKGVQK